MIFLKPSPVVMVILKMNMEGIVICNGSQKKGQGIVVETAIWYPPQITEQEINMRTILAAVMIWQTTEI
jgi:hypothetical protein